MDFLKGSFIHIRYLVAFTLVDKLVGEGFVPDTESVTETHVLGLEDLVVDALINALLLR